MLSKGSACNQQTYTFTMFTSIFLIENSGKKQQANIYLQRIQQKLARS